jgi:hypothetical protein
MKTTLEMAREAGNGELFDAMQVAFLERFEAFVRADERETCAKVCDAIYVEYEDGKNMAVVCAANIRARGKHKLA